MMHVCQQSIFMPASISYTAKEGCSRGTGMYDGGTCSTAEKLRIKIIQE